MINPDINWIYPNWAEALTKLKRYEDAITQYQKALDLDRSAVSGRSHIKLVQALIELKKPEQALTQCEDLLSSIGATGSGCKKKPHLLIRMVILLNKPM